MKHLGLILLLLLLFTTYFSFGQGDNTVAFQKSIEAIRVETPPKMDGVLDDNVWNIAM